MHAVRCQANALRNLREHRFIQPRDRQLPLLREPDKKGIILPGREIQFEFRIFADWRDGGEDHLRPDLRTTVNDLGDILLIVIELHAHPRLRLKDADLDRRIAVPDVIDAGGEHNPIRFMPEHGLLKSAQHILRGVPGDASHDGIHQNAFGLQPMDDQAAIPAMSGPASRDGIAQESDLLPILDDGLRALRGTGPHHIGRCRPHPDQNCQQQREVPVHGDKPNQKAARSKAGAHQTSRRAPPDGCLVNPGGVSSCEGSGFECRRHDKKVAGGGAKQNHGNLLDQHNHPPRKGRQRRWELRELPQQAITSKQSMVSGSPSGAQPMKGPGFPRGFRVASPPAIISPCLRHSGIDGHPYSECLP